MMYGVKAPATFGSKHCGRIETERLDPRQKETIAARWARPMSVETAREYPAVFHGLTYSGGTRAACCCHTETSNTPHVETRAG